MNSKFINNLKKIRKNNNLSQEQLAEILGISRQAISKWESGSAYPEMEKIIQLCEKFNVPVIIDGDIETLSRSIGKSNKAIIGIKDINFAETIQKKYNGGDVIG